jgi:hypothetical protein
LDRINRIYRIGGSREAGFARRAEEGEEDRRGIFDGMNGMNGMVRRGNWFEQRTEEEGRGSKGNF